MQFRDDRKQWTEAETVAALHAEFGPAEAEAMIQNATE
jgi:hypothetical protein